MATPNVFVRQAPSLDIAPTCGEDAIVKAR